MGMYSDNSNELEGLDVNALIEAFMADDLAHNYPEATVHEFCAQGGAADALLEAGALRGKRTIVAMDKKSDLTRREVITAIHLARAAKDPLYGKLVKYQLLRKQTRQKIVEKYGNKAKRAAVKAQKAYMQAMRGVSINLNPNQVPSRITGDPNR